MKVVHVIVGLGVGGAELMLERLLLYSDQPARRHRVISLCGFDNAEARMQANRLRSAGIPVDALNLSGPWHIIGALARLTKMIRKECPDLVQTWMYHSDLIGGLAARLAGCHNIVWNLRTNALPRSAFPRRTRLMQRFCALMAYLIPKKIIAASHAALDSHVSIGYPKHRIIVIGNGFKIPDAEDLHAARPRLRKAWGLAPDDCAIGMVGRFDRLKGQENFIRAAGLMAGQYPRASFFIIGRQCETINVDLMKWVEEAGLRGRIQLLGERHDIADCLSAFDVFCLPSVLEGFPNALGEAMAAGRACVATSTGGSVELLAGHGLLVPAGDSPALADAMARLVGLSSGERETIGQAARHHIVETYGLAKIVRQYVDLYDTVTGLAARPASLSDGQE